MGKRIIFYRPCPSVMPVSITGSRCELDCPHCKGKYLSGMAKATMPPDLVRSFLAAKGAGAKRILITGGFTRAGRLPVEPMLSAIEEGKKRTGLGISMHAGLIDNSLMKRLRAAGVDTLLMDVVGSQETIESYLCGGWRVEDYRLVLRAAKENFQLLAPHVLIGIDRGNVKGEYVALDLIAEVKPGACALLVLMNGDTPDEGEVRKVMEYAREKIKSHLTLGCMRGKGRARTAYEMAAISLNFDGIANPSQEGMEYARKEGIDCVRSDDCCVHPPLG